MNRVHFDVKICIADSENIVVILVAIFFVTATDVTTMNQQTLPIEVPRETACLN